MPLIMASTALAAGTSRANGSRSRSRLTGIAGSATTAGQKPVVVGKVTAISGSTLTVTDTKTNAQYTVDVSSAKITEGFGSGAQSIGYSSIKVGDEVIILGTVTGSSVSATSVFDGVEGAGFRKAPRVIGTVTAVSGSTLNVSVQQHASSTAVVYTVNTSTSTTVTKDGKADTFSDIAIGQTVMVMGTVSTSGNTVAATKVNIVTRIPQAHVTGTVKAVSGSTLTVQPKTGTSYSVDASSATVTTGFGKNAQASSLASISVGQSVMVVGSHVAGSMNIVASSIRLVQPKAGA